MRVYDDRLIRLILRVFLDAYSRILKQVHNESLFIRFENLHSASLGNLIRALQAHF